MCRLTAANRVLAPAAAFERRLQPGCRRSVQRRQHRDGQRRRHRYREVVQAVVVDEVEVLRAGARQLQSVSGKRDVRP